MEIGLQKRFINSYLIEYIFSYPKVQKLLFSLAILQFLMLFGDFKTKYFPKEAELKS